MSETADEREGEIQYLTWSEFEQALGMPPKWRALSEAQMRYGICSESGCWWPIGGWCVTCGAKLCRNHLHEHKNLHARERLRVAAQEASDGQQQQRG